MGIWDRGIGRRCGTEKIFIKKVIRASTGTKFTESNPCITVGYIIHISPVSYGSCWRSWTVWKEVSLTVAS
jgi:hypothetical protein